MNPYRPTLPPAEAERRLRAYPALVAACRAALQHIKDFDDHADFSHAEYHAIKKQLRDALAAAGESTDTEGESHATTAL